ncbi:MAG: hypothetical protein IJF55_02400 [Clostridia bacterium]|nr:hypothetical protein [Clostridia bacterium]
MTVLAIGYDAYAIIFITILVAVLIVVFSQSYKSKRVAQIEKEVEAVIDESISDDDVEDEDEDDDPDKDPEVIEIHGCVVHKECYSGMNSSVRHPHAYKNFIINFRSDDGKDFEYSIDEETYLSIEEGDSGYVAIVGERFYGYCSDKDAADEIEE